MEMNNQPPTSQQPSSGPKGPQGHGDWSGHDMWCSHHGGGRHSALRIILGLILLALVFSLGCMIGKFHAYKEHGYGHRGGHFKMMRYYPQEMPLGGYMMEDSAPKSVAPAQPALPAPAPK